MMGESCSSPSGRVPVDLHRLSSSSSRVAGKPSPSVKPMIPPAPAKSLIPASAASSATAVKNKSYLPPFMSLSKKPSQSSLLSAPMASGQVKPIPDPKPKLSTATASKGVPTLPPAPKKPLSSTTATSSKIAKLAPPKPPVLALDANLFGHDEDSELSDVASTLASTSPRGAAKRKMVVEVEAATEKEAKKVKTGKQQHGSDEENEQAAHALDPQDDDDGPATLAEPPVKQTAGKKSYGTSKKPSSAAATPKTKQSVVGAMKSKQPVGASSSKSKKVLKEATPAPEPDEGNIGAGTRPDARELAVEIDEFDDLPSLPTAARRNPIVARREPPPAKTSKKKAAPQAKPTPVKRTPAKRSKPEPKSKETIAPADENEEAGGTKGRLRTRSGKNVATSEPDDEAQDEPVARGGGSARRSALVAQRRLAQRTVNKKQKEQSDEEVVEEHEVEETEELVVPPSEKTRDKKGKGKAREHVSSLLQDAPKTRRGFDIPLPFLAAVIRSGTMSTTTTPFLPTTPPWTSATTTATSLSLSSTSTSPPLRLTLSSSSTTSPKPF